MGAAGSAQLSPLHQAAQLQCSCVHRECIQDCTAALGQLSAEQQPMDAEGKAAVLAKQQAKLHVRRASALLASGSSAGALQDMQEVPVQTLT